METIIKSPGLQHIFEDIFSILDVNNLMACRLVNSSWNNIQSQPMFWLKRLDSSNLLKDVKRSWTILAQELSNDDNLIQEFALILIKINHNEKPILPLEIFMKLQRSMKFPDLMKLILEHEDPRNKVEVDIAKGDMPALFNIYWEWKWFRDEKRYTTPIHLAAFNGWAEVVDKLATNCDDVSMVTCQRTGRNPIHYAAMNGHTDVVKILSNFTDTPNAPDKRKYTPIHFAAENGHLDTVEFLVTITGKPLLPDFSGHTPIHSAASIGHLELVKFLVELALKLNEEPISKAWDYTTPIHCAAYSGHLNIVKFLVDFTNNPDAEDINRRTPSCFANQNSHSAIVKFLDEYCKRKGTV